MNIVPAPFAQHVSRWRRKALLNAQQLSFDVLMIENEDEVRLKGM
jgi:hypothetical protein